MQDDKNQAFYRYKKSAEQGNADAQCVLAACYNDGIGCEKDKNQAFYWYQKSAELRNEAAKEALAEM